MRTIGLILATRVILGTVPGIAQSSNGARIATLEYGGGGDWYANPTALANLAEFAAQQGLSIQAQPGSVPVGSASLSIRLGAFNRSRQRFLHAGGSPEPSNLPPARWIPAHRRQLRHGSLHPQSDENRLASVRLGPPSAQHPLFHGPFEFPRGLPKIHEHDGKAPQAWGLYHGDRLVVLYTYECDLSDGWEDPEVHNDPPAVRLQALRMGSNILHYVFRGQIPYEP